jgi:hypothetical protein
MPVCLVYITVCVAAYSTCSPKDALLFAMDAQQQLLHVAWPHELLGVPQCSPVFVQGM